MLLKVCSFQAKPAFGTSSQDGGISRRASPPCTTIKRITTNLKTKNSQNCQKIELCGSPTTKDLKKTHSSRPIGRAQLWKQAERWCSMERWRWWGWQQRRQQSRWEGHLRSEQSQPKARLHSRGFQHQEGKSSVTSGCKNQWRMGWQKKLSDFCHLKG